MHGGTCRRDTQLNLPVTPSLWGREACQPSRLGPGAAAWQGSEVGSACQPHVLLCALHPACSRSSTSDTSYSRAWPPLPKQKSRAGEGSRAGSENRAPDTTGSLEEVSSGLEGRTGTRRGLGAFLGHYTGCSQESRQPPLCPLFWWSRWLTMQVLSPDLCSQLLLDQRGWGRQEEHAVGSASHPVPLQEGEQHTQPQLQHPVMRSEQGK